MIEISMKIKISDGSGPAEEAGIEIRGDVTKLAGMLMSVLDKHLSYKEGDDKK